MIDMLKIPKDLPAGEYVLGWRLDCESTAQVWSNCADVTLVEKTKDLKSKNLWEEIKEYIWKLE